MLSVPKSIYTFLGGDLTPIEHALYGLLMQAITAVIAYPILGLKAAVLCGAVFASAFFLGREHAQQQDFFSETEQPLGDWEALQFWQWDRASFMDLLCPVLTVTLTSILIGCIS